MAPSRGRLVIARFIPLHGVPTPLNNRSYPSTQCREQVLWLVGLVVVATYFAYFRPDILVADVIAGDKYDKKTTTRYARSLCHHCCRHKQSTRDFKVRNPPLHKETDAIEWHKGLKVLDGVIGGSLHGSVSTNHCSTPVYTKKSHTGQT